VSGVKLADRVVPRILIADNHALFRQALGAYLRVELPAARIGQAVSGAAALAHLRIVRWDVLLLDISLGDMSGLDVLQVVQRDFPGLPVMIVSIHTDPPVISRCLTAGARVYVTKDEAASVLVTIIGKFQSGGRLRHSRLLKKARKQPRRAPHRTRHTCRATPTLGPPGRGAY
jgi:DNA-binding NarL/FixJ family response regulator